MQKPFSIITFECTDFDKVTELLDEYFCCENDYPIRIVKEKDTFYVTIIPEDE